MIDLEPSFLDEVKRILHEHAGGIEVRAFGSRINGTARRFSDLDLALVSKEQIDWRQMEALKDAFAESNLPLQVDVLDWHTLSDSFRKIIETSYEVILE